jgi:thiol:disulfide interchange protein
MSHHRSARRAAVGATLAALVLWAGPALAGGDWNDKQIAWKPYDQGIAEARKEKKPICLILYTEWCPHCTNYSGVFHDAKVVDKAKEFVMIRVDADKNQTVGAEFALDGKYIPRTYFLSPDGKVDPDLTAGRPQYKYFYDEKNPASILAGMDAALKKFD